MIQENKLARTIMKINKKVRKTKRKFTMGRLRWYLFFHAVQIIAAFGMDMFISSWSLHYYEFLIGCCANTNRQIRRTKISVFDRSFQ